MGYYIELKNISIDNYKERLKAADLLPSRMVLKENIEMNFNSIKNQNIRNVDELQQELRNKNKLQDFSKQTGLSEEYLKILIREINSYHPTPNNIKDFPETPGEVISRLEKLGIKNTLKLYDKILTPEGRNEISMSTGIDGNEMMRLTKLTDLSRIRWVNHTFAYVLLEAGYDTAEKVARADYKQLYEMIKQLNEERKIYKGHIGLYDMKLCVEAAQDVSFEIDYQ